MERLKEYIKSNKAIFSKEQVGMSAIIQAEKLIGVKFGVELIDYLNTFGFLICNGVELYGINVHQGIDSDLIQQTLYLNNYFPKTIGYIAVENQGEGNYYVVDTADKVYQYNSELDKMIPTGQSLSDYLALRFEESKL